VYNSLPPFFVFRVKKKYGMDFARENTGVAGVLLGAFCGHEIVNTSMKPRLAA
jgi:hypothetical protein